MRLSEVLSRPIAEAFVQVEGFLDNQRLRFGKQKKITVGRVALNFFCRRCNDDRTFCSGEELFCLGVNDRLISIDCALKCTLCDSMVQTWFLVESEGDISAHAPVVRINKRSEKLSDMVLLAREQHDDFSELIEKANRAHRDGLGAGSIVYLRKIFERITEQTAEASHISTETPRGGRKPFRNLLEEVERRTPIIPREFAENGYRLFGELSDVVHGDYDELEGLRKYGALKRLVIGVIDKVKNNRELMAAIGTLGWDDERETPV